MQFGHILVLCLRASALSQKHLQSVTRRDADLVAFRPAPFGQAGASSGGPRRAKAQTVTSLTNQLRQHDDVLFSSGSQKCRRVREGTSQHHVSQNASVSSSCPKNLCASMCTKMCCDPSKSLEPWTGHTHPMLAQVARCAVVLPWFQSHALHPKWIISMGSGLSEQRPHRSILRGAEGGPLTRGRALGSNP